MKISVYTYAYKHEKHRTKSKTIQGKYYREHVGCKVKRKHQIIFDYHSCSQKES